MQACQFYGFSGFVLEKGKDLNLARLAAEEDWVRQDQEEVLEDDEVDAYFWYNHNLQSILHLCVTVVTFQTNFTAVGAQEG